MTGRREFAERRLLKVYLEQAHFGRLIELAREAGQAVSEYVRGILLEHLEEPEKLPRAGRVRVVGGGLAADERVTWSDGGSGVPSCGHGKRAGELCYKCDPKFGRPIIGG